jgi:isocitrate dehydrogenase
MPAPSTITPPKNQPVPTMPEARTSPVPVTLIPGDGIGPEVVQAARRLVDATGVSIAWEEAHAGAEVFRKGVASGVPLETIESIRRTRLVLKGPLETPVGYGEKKRQRHAAKTVRDVRQSPPGPRIPRRPHPLLGPRHRPRGGAGERRGPLRRASNTSRPPASPSASRSSRSKGCEKIVRLAFEVGRVGGPLARCTAPPRPTS